MQQNTFNERHAGWTRRELLQKTGTGFGALALAGLLADETDGSAPARSERQTLLAVRPVHFAPRAKRCVFLFMPGGPSQIDLFDPKPRVTREDGKPLPFEKPRLERTPTNNLFGSPWKFSRHGESGLEVSELLPHLASRADELCVIRSMVADNINHSGASLQMNTGEQAFSRPSLGSWVLYGLGTENQDLPGFVVITPVAPFQKAPLWSSSFLPAAYQGTLVKDLKNPIRNLKAPRGDLTRQRKQLDTLRRLNEIHRRRRNIESELEARIASFELAFRMQMRAPEAFAIDRESTATKRLYGLDDETTETMGKQCLLARRLLERGVRFIQIYDPETWDHHQEIADQLPKRCAGVDLPIAGLLADLKDRGLLDDTLVIWGGEFGRTPTAEGKGGREHHPFGFTMWLAGGGVKGGHVHGATDEYGWWAVEDKVHVHDLHATILYLMGLDHEQLTYRYGGRDYRLTDVYGKVVQDILA